LKSRNGKVVAWCFFVIAAACLVSFLSSYALALDLKLDDLSASVEVVPVFSLTLDNPALSFGLIGPGQKKVIGEGRFFNEIRCRSNSGRPWYLKAQLVSLRVAEKNFSLPFANLKWKIAETTGSDSSAARRDFQPFSAESSVIYASMGDDLKGKEVVLRFQYRLESPADAPSGNYVGQIVFTLAENP